ADLSLHRDSAGGGVFLVGRELSTAEPWRVAELDLELVCEAGGTWRLDGVRQTLHGIDPEAEAKPQLEQTIDQAFDAFRQSYGRRLPASAPVDREGLERFTLQALREAARTEIAILNQGALRPVDARHFAETPLPRETVMRLLSYDQGVVVGSLKGSELAALIAESVTRHDDDGSPRQTSLRFAGVEYEVANPGTPEATASAIRINSHPLYPDDLYSVATNSWLAGGGDGYPELARLEGEVLRRGVEEPVEMREDIVLPRLDEAERPLDDPASRGLWRFGIQRFTFGFDGIEVDADEAYGDVSDSRASTDASRAVRADVRLFADQQWSRLRWENRLRARFGLLDPRDGDSEQEELQDDLRLDISAVFLDRTLLAGNPYLGYIVDTEIRAEVGDDDERLPRQFEQSLTAGLEWSTDLMPRIRFGVLARHQDDAEEAERLGALFDLNLRRKARGVWPAVELDVLAEWAEDSEATVERFDLEVRFPITIRKYLKLAPTWNFYRYRDSRLPGAAEFRRFSLNLSWSWSDKYQR
ncbi:MAG: 5'-nucleotidase, partial [Acidobacteriota bacterium]